MDSIYLPPNKRKYILRKLVSIFLLSVLFLVTVPQELHVIFEQHHETEHCKIPSHYHISELHNHCTFCQFHIPFFNYASIYTISTFTEIQTKILLHESFSLKTRIYLLSKPRAPPYIS